MEKRYGIFMLNNETWSYGEGLKGKHLIKMNFGDFISEEKAMEYIDSNLSPGNDDYYILGFIKHTKPHSAKK